MTTKEQRIQEAWSDHYKICNSETTLCGTMICEKCKREIEGLYLVQDRINCLLRGNENDEKHDRQISELYQKIKELEEKKYNLLSIISIAISFVAIFLVLFK